MAAGGSSLVPCVCWVPKGASKEIPDKVELKEEELQELIRGAQEEMRHLNMSEAVGEEREMKGGRKMEGEREMEKESAELSLEEEYNLDNYSTSESEGEGEKVSGAGMGNGLAGLAYFASNDSDPYITLKKTAPEDDEEEDFKVLSSDNLLLVGRADDEFSSIEVHVFSEDDFHSYSHHEILLTSFPLALEWTDYDPGEPDKKGSYVVVGMMTPGIEIWDLDLVDGLEPVLTLGDSKFDMSLKAMRSKKKKGKHKKGSGAAGEGVRGAGDSHSDAVLGLSWNRIVRTALASASADKTVRVWDMSGPKCVLTLPHPDKVQCVQWHPYEPQLLATGAYDGRVRLYNCMTSKATIRVWKLDGEVERVLWNHLKPEQLLASTDSHTVHCLNRNTDPVLFQIHAHTDAIADLSLSCYVPGLLVTASTDDTIKFWDIQEDKPVFLLSKDMHMGAVLCARFSLDSPYAMAVGGTKNGFQILDVRQMESVVQRVRGRDLMVPLPPEKASTNGGRELSKHLEEEMVGDREESLVDEEQENEVECVRGETEIASGSEHLVEAMDTESSRSRETNSLTKRDGKTKKKGKRPHKRRGRK